MSKPTKPRGLHGQGAGVYKPEAIRDIAESLNITGLPDAVASALASDVEYRIHQVVEEAARFMRHARRTTMTTDDIDQALRVLNIEPLYGHSPHNPPTFRRAISYPPNSATGTLYFVEDEEIDFDRVLREEKITLPKPVSWTAHWLAVEGVQPLIPENPPAITKDTEEPSALKTITGQPSTSALPTQTTTKGRQQNQQLVKQVLSRELQLYYARLTSSLLPPTPEDYAKRTAALASLRHDAGLQALLPYIVRWVAEGVVNTLRGGSQTEADGRVLEVFLDVISALLENSTLFVEPYLHQMLPPVLSILLHSSLPPSHSAHLRTSAAQTMSHLLTQHSTTYPSLAPRIMKTLLLALVSTGKSRGTREGAIRGLVGVGKDAIRKGLIEGHGAKVVAQESQMPGYSSLAETVMDAFATLFPRSKSPAPLNPADSNDADVVRKLRESVGDFFAERMVYDSAWAKGVLGEPSSDDVDMLI